MNIYDFIKIRKKENQIYIDDLVKIFPMNKYSMRFFLATWIITLLLSIQVPRIP